MIPHRLVRSEDFTRAYREGKSRSHRLLALHYARNPHGYARVGYVAGRGVGGAVARNRAKRLLREATRGLAERLTPGYDLVLVARRPLSQAHMQDAREAIRDVLGRAGLLRDRE
ncbi:MAG: ribonuclease P protein component [Actinobacteria bacterium]|nr:MAG: ribonuclease P protein component [Actinomycetota bacterium]